MPAAHQHAVAYGLKVTVLKIQTQTIFPLCPRRTRLHQGVKTALPRSGEERGSPPIWTPCFSCSSLRGMQGRHLEGGTYLPSPHHPRSRECEAKGTNAIIAVSHSISLPQKPCAIFGITQINIGINIWKVWPFYFLFQIGSRSILLTGRERPLEARGKKESRWKANAKKRIIDEADGTWKWE